MVQINVYIKVNLENVQSKIFFSVQDRIFSIASKNTFDCVTLSGTIYLDFHLPTLIYVITCSRCSLQYVGKTDQKICFKNHKECSFYWIVSNHFHKGIFKNAPYTVSLLKQVDDNEIIPRVALDASITSKRKLK